MPTESFFFEKKTDWKASSKAPGKFQRSITEKPEKRGANEQELGLRLTLKEREMAASQMAKLLQSVVSKAQVADDYTIMIDAKDLPEGYDESMLLHTDHEYPEDEPEGEAEGERPPVPPLNICILIVGTRGDVQPFIAIGKRLQEYGHRVRLATHANFREFVTESGLEFFPLGGDPKVLAEYMVKNKGFLPSNPQEILTQRKQLKAIVESTWPAVTEPDTEANGQPFVADAIMANPPSLGHVHVAEALKIPLHICFTMPWTPTREWPHPLARVAQVAGFENRLSYAVVENVIWIGARDIVNGFRKNTLKLPAVTYLGSMTGHTKKVVPHAYIWSPSLAPKPKDWGRHIDVVGFCFLNLASNYKPPEDLMNFLKAGSAPIFVGFGSLVVQDPKGMTRTIVRALQKTGQRGIIQKGWGGLGELDEMPDYVFSLGNCPHDWLFPQCKAVVHHGGAGTTAAGLKAACPTTVVPFFGDQPFWGGCCQREGVGPEPIPVGRFSLEHLVSAIEFMLRPEVKEASEIMAAKISQEDGVEGAVEAFHRHLPKGIKHGDHVMPWMRKKAGLPGASFLNRMASCSCASGGRVQV